MAGLAMLVLAGCSSAEPAEDVPSATVPTAPATTTTTDPYAVPAVIDEAYVNRVLAGLDAAVGEVVRMVVRTRTIPREAVDRLRAVYATDARLQLKIDSFQQDLRANLPGYRLPEPGNKRSVVHEMISVEPQCIYVRVQRDYSASSIDPIPELATQWIAIKPLDRSRDPFAYNQVRWAYLYEGFARGFSAPATDPCRG